MSTANRRPLKNPEKRAILSGITPGYRTAPEWAALGVKVQRDEGDLPRQERETSIAFIDSERTAEVNTCRRDWQKRLEAAGARPQSIQVFDKSDAEFRWYIVPKAWVKKPYKSGKEN